MNSGAQTRKHSSFNEIIERRRGSDVIVILSDDNGNETDDGTFTFQWDYKNRLRTVNRKSDSALIAAYAYDAADRRIRKVVTTSGTIDFDYDGWRTIEERNGADVLTQQYVHGIYLDEPLILDRNLNGDTSATGAGDERLFYHQNTLYSTFALTDTSGAVVEGYQYDAYGRQKVFGPGFTTILGSQSAQSNPYMFTGQRFDSETGLMYYKNRYYSTELGRFLQRDPLEYVDGMNLYEYVSGNPTYWLDPFGGQQEVNLTNSAGLPVSDAGLLTEEVDNKLEKWLMKDCELSPGRPTKERIRFSFEKCTEARKIIPQILPKDFMQCVLGSWTSPRIRRLSCTKLLTWAVTLAGYFDTPESYGLNPDAEYCGNIEVTRHSSFKQSEKPPIIMSRTFWLIFEVRLKGCNGADDVSRSFRLDLLKWQREFKDKEKQEDWDRKKPPFEQGPPIETK